MPELPEVETVRRGLAPVMEGNRIAQAQVNRPDLRWPFPERMAERLTGARILQLRRRSKYILGDLDSGEMLLAQNSNPWATGPAAGTEDAGSGAGASPAPAAPPAPDASSGGASNPWGSGGGSDAAGSAATPAAGGVDGAATPDWLSNAAPAPVQHFDPLHPFDHSVIPLQVWVEHLLDWVVSQFRPVFQAIRWPIDGVLSGVDALLLGTPALVMLAFIGLLAWQLAGPRLAIGSVVAMTFVGLIGAWNEAMVTLAD